jgi:hypothetical protein
LSANDFGYFAAAAAGWAPAALLDALGCARLTGLSPLRADALSCPGFAVSGFASTGPFSVFGVRMAPAPENPPGAATRGIMITLAGWFF